LIGEQFLELGEFTWRGLQFCANPSLVAAVVNPVS